MARVLVIDDETIVATILSYAFDSKGYETLVADGGRAGIDLARTEHPDAIILDLMMPTVNGLDVLQELRGDEATKQVPILVLTAVTMSREHNECLSSGADMVMTKPFDPQDIAAAVETMLAHDVQEVARKAGTLPA
jgi:DNA-binding response OmpR family regulator